MKIQRHADVVRWVARVSAVGSVGLILAFLIGEPPAASQITPSQWFGLAFFPAGVCAGMILGWWREGFGGAVTVASLAAFYATRLATTGNFPAGWAFSALAAPGLLFLLSWRLAVRRT
jgi:hypothetical protein